MVSNGTQTAISWVKVLCLFGIFINPNLCHKQTQTCSDQLMSKADFLSVLRLREPSPGCRSMSGVNCLNSLHNWAKKHVSQNVKLQYFIFHKNVWLHCIQDLFYLKTIWEMNLYCGVGTYGKIISAQRSGWVIKK